MKLYKYVMNEHQLYNIHTVPVVLEGRELGGGGVGRWRALEGRWMLRWVALWGVGLHFGAMG